MLSRVEYACSFVTSLNMAEFVTILDEIDDWFKVIFFVILLFLKFNIVIIRGMLFVDNNV